MTVTRELRALSADDRSHLERILGERIDPANPVTVEFKPAFKNAEDAGASGVGPFPLPDWFDDLAGMTDEEVAAFEEAMSHRLDFSRN